MTISASVYLDNAIKNFTRSLFVPLGIFRDWMLIYFLMPLKAIFQSMPWTGVMLLAGAIGWTLGRRKIAITVMMFVFFIASSGYWVRAMITVYMVFASLIICSLIGIPLGIWASKKENRSNFALDMRVIFLRELLEGDPVVVNTQLLDYDTKRLHFLHYIDHESKNFTACLNESVGIHVNVDERETSKFSDEILRRIESLAEVHSKIPRPKQIMRQMGLR